MLAYAETYQDVEKLIWSIVHKFQRQYGGELEELFGEAQVIFCELYTGNGRPYIRQKNDKAFAASLSYYIKVNLLSMRRTQLMRDSRKPISSVDPQKLQALAVNDEQNTGLVDLMDSLSDDCRDVVQLILSTPGFVWRMEEPLVRTRDPEVEGGLVGLVHEYLRLMDWSDRKIRRCFNEIRKALQ